MWQVLICGALIVSLAMGIRHGFGLWMQPMTQTMGWGREDFAMAIAVQNISWGLIGVFSGMLTYQTKELCIKALRSLLFLLYHNFPKVRKSAAEKLYTSMLTMEDYSMLIDSEEVYEQALEVLSETDWALPVAVLTEQTKARFYGYFGQELKVTKKTEGDE